MDLYSELKKNKQQLENNEISKEEYDERQIFILNKWSGESKSHSHVVNKSKENDLYVTLQLTPTATGAEIKSKYRKLVLKYHPDKNGGTETEEWTNLLKAYQTLSDEDSRALYDKFRTVNNTFMDKASFNYHVGGELWKPYIGDLEIGLWLFSFMDSKLINFLNFRNTILDRLSKVFVKKLRDFLWNPMFYGGLTYGFLVAIFKEMNQKEFQKVVWNLSISEISSIAHETCEKALDDKEREKSIHLAHSLFFLGKVWEETSKQPEIKP
ncbi:DnaJ-domain-containing protein [Rhizophagus clarus]|uniref:DnaJ-domain-containing protein n=1 Tax=Rhizophagus clarus TaxID=94130 RepID=A0A8H3LJN0_9GLOM|nr:DnaJ-domain-containing protein [Rhizophagus clarus]